ncbi:hypothetical protein MMC07_001001 [Pseudocyphellaria aurata]|nr:hypothetical protein [Pseudocyphellaria aurata]
MIYFYHRAENIDDDELELMKGTPAVPRPISFASETNPASSSHSATATFLHSRPSFPFASRNSDDNEWNLSSVQSPRFESIGVLNNVTQPRRDPYHHDKARDLASPQPAVIIDLRDASEEENFPVTRRQPTEIVDLGDTFREEDLPYIRRQPTEIIDLQDVSEEEECSDRHPVEIIDLQNVFEEEECLDRDPPEIIDLQDVFEEEECSDRKRPEIIDLQDVSEEECLDRSPPDIIDLQDGFEEVLGRNNPPAKDKTKERRRSQSARQLNPIQRRNLPIVAPSVILDSFTFNNVKVNSKANLELCDGDFLRVVDIVQDTNTEEVTLRGWRFRRTKEMNGMLERKMNEICWIVHVDEDDTRDEGVQGMESVPVSEVVKRRRIRITNRPYPQLSWQEHSEADKEVILNERVLVCRYKYVIYYPDAKARERNSWTEKAMQRIQAEECDSSCSMADQALRYSWRGNTIKGGACMSLVPGEIEYLRKERQHYNVDESLETRKRRRESLACQSERRRRSVDSLSTGLDLERTQDTAIDDDLQEIDPSLLSTQVSNRLKLQPSPKRAGAVELQYIDRRSFVGRIRPSSHKTDQLESQKSSKPEFVHATKRQKLSLQPSHASKSDIIDLTNDEPNQMCHLFNEARSEHCKRSGVDVSSSRYNSPEVVEVRAQIDTSCKFGTMRREYQGQITSTYVPRNSKSHCSINYTTEKPNKKCALPISRALSTKPQPTPVSPDISRLSSIAGQRYTFGDCFCGAGGASRGAVDAGLRVEWGFDFDLSACKSYKSNYIATAVYNIDTHHFSGLTDKEYKVDICHMSPPCQYFSDAHTVSGKDDDRNVAALFAVLELLRQAKPRVVTVEETSGLLRRHSLFFNALIHMFTAHGFSIRWKLIECANYGVPQSRHRLIMIASCPGEVLPVFPKPTHTKDLARQPHLKPWVTINEAISSIPSTCADHNIDFTVGNVNGIPYDGNRLARCITTSGGGNFHPSGQRNFTIREFACLQTFPHEQKFHTSGAKTQIGNAFPPIVAKLILEEVKKSLMKADGLL